MRILYSALLALFLALPAGAGTLAGVTLPDKAEVKGQALVLNGMALRSKFFIKVYVAGLYLQHKEKTPAAILGADAPRQQVMHFLYDVTKEQMCEAWGEGLEENSPNASAEVKKGFTSLCGWMEPIKKGNRIVLTYIPGEGTHVEVNGKTKGTLEGKATADAVLNTWIGPKPGPGADFKKAILGG
ncbi:MAG TPA: chalcone isomerase family protein [Thermoanaerobaculia bacterium]|nr:chalcone isomerase family protein [Thermoanaerobaculia bacterium]